ncbi:VENN motif pre-toxin domain-containing protein, partial [Pseudothauera rhizosphaerae]
GYDYNEAGISPEEAVKRKGEHDSLLQLGAALAGAAVGTLAGDTQGAATGASTAFVGVTNNYLTHEQIKQKQERLAEAESEEGRQAIEQEYADLDVRQRDEAEACLLSGNCNSVFQSEWIKTVLADLNASCAPPRICGPDQKASIAELRAFYAQAEGITAVYPLESLVAFTATGGTLTFGRVAVGSGLGGGFDVAGQTYKIYTGQQDEYRFAQTVIASGTGVWAYPLAGKSILGNAALGGTVGGTNTALTNWWYGENKSVSGSTFEGAFFGGSGTVIGRWASGHLQKTQPLFIGNKPYDPSVPILLQNVRPNPYPNYAGRIIEQEVSNIPAFRDSEQGDGK